MKKTRTLPLRISFRATVAWVLLGLLTACAVNAIPPQAGQALNGAVMEWPVPSPTAQPSAAPSPTPVIWNTFPAPRGDSATAVPDAAPRIALPDDVQVWLLLMSDQEAPLVGRTQAFHVVLLNERLAKASVISIPSNLMVYLPGENMQRLSTAYALGGMQLVRETLAYNFGLRPDRYVVAHPTEFKWLVDDLGGIDVSVLIPVRDACGGLPAGLHSMNGDKAFCYVSFLSDEDEVYRVRRQQQVLQLLFTKLVQNGRLAMLPLMYASYQEKLDTDISFLDLLGRVPLALRLGDPQRVSYHVLGWEYVTAWELPDETQATVLLPRADAVRELFAQALAEISQPSPLGEIVLTYEAQLTQAVALTQTMQPGFTQTPPVRSTPTATPTPTPRGAPTAFPTAILPTSIYTQEPYPFEPTAAGTPTPTDVYNPYP